MLSAVWRYRWLVLFLALAFGGLGWYYATSSEQWSAEGVLSVQDPRSSNLFDRPPEAPQRYVLDQVAILESRTVARRAAELLLDEDPPIEVEVDDVASDLEVSSDEDSNLIVMSYTSSTPQESIGVVNAVATAYNEVSRATAEATFAAALDELDESLEAIRRELNDLEQRLLDLRQADIDRQALRDQLAEARTALLEFEFPGPNASQEALNLANGRLNALQARISTLQAALEDDPDDVALTNLLQQQTQARQRLSDLQTRRDQISVDAELAGSGVVFYSPAEDAEPGSVGLWVVIGTLFGGVVGAAVAYLLAHRRRRFAARAEPQIVLGVPLVTDVPHFSQERLRTVLPVADAPASASAEAFRFVGAGITVQQIDRAGNGAAIFKSVAITSAGLFDGKTTVTANTAFAAAREGSKVLVVDADFGTEALTQALLGNVQRPMGMTDVAYGSIGLGDAVIRVTKEHAGSVALLTRGTVDVSAPDFFSSQQAAKMFEVAARDYDLILLDAPPLLRVAYTTTVVRLADRVLVVVAHGSDVTSAAELRRQMEMIGTPPLGYVYNQAPLRPEMTLSAGSMANTLGAQHAARR